MRRLPSIGERWTWVIAVIGVALALPLSAAPARHYDFVAPDLKIQDYTRTSPVSLENPPAAYRKLFLPGSTNAVVFGPRTAYATVIHHTSVVQTIPAGKRVTVLAITRDVYRFSGTDDFWYKIRWRRKVGWVFGGVMIDATDFEGYEIGKRIYPHDLGYDKRGLLSWRSDYFSIVVFDKGKRRVISQYFLRDPADFFTFDVNHPRNMAGGNLLIVHFKIPDYQFPDDAGMREDHYGFLFLRIDEHGRLVPVFRYYQFRGMQFGGMVDIKRAVFDGDTIHLTYSYMRITGLPSFGAGPVHLAFAYDPTTKRYRLVSMDSSITTSDPGTNRHPITSRIGIRDFESSFYPQNASVPDLENPVIFGEGAFTTTGPAEVISGNLRLRTSASLDAPVMTLLPTGERLEIIDTAPARITVDGLTSYWYRVRTTGNLIGWVFGAFIRRN